MIDEPMLVRGGQLDQYVDAANTEAHADEGSRPDATSACSRLRAHELKVSEHTLPACSRAQPDLVDAAYVYPIHEGNLEADTPSASRLLALRDPTAIWRQTHDQTGPRRALS